MDNETQDVQAQSVVTWVERTVCPACGFGQSKINEYFGQIAIRACLKCQLMWSSKMMSREELARYYESDFGGPRHMSGQKINAAVNITIVKRMIALRRLKSAVDIGTGYGYFLQKLRKHTAANLQGYEISKSEAMFGVRVLGLDIKNQAAPRREEACGVFDLACCFEVIEHVPDPVEFLRDLISQVKVGGAVLIMTDNFKSTVARSMGKRFPKWIPHAHLNHFCPQSLESIINNVGLKLVQKASFTPWELYVQRILAQLSRCSDRDSGYEIEKEMRTEMKKSYRHYGIRKLLSPLWARCAVRRDLKGELMYALAVRTE